MSKSVAVLCALLPMVGVGAQDLLVQCKTLVVAPDTVLSPGELLVRDGRVAHVGREIPMESRSRARILRFADATVVPGFVLAHSTLGQGSDLAERADPLTPSLRAAEAFDPFQEELQRLPREAVTSCVLAPASTNVGGGIAALVKPGVDMGTVRLDDGYAMYALCASARDPERPPTSLMGAVDLLRQAFVSAREGAAGGPDAVAVSAVLRSERRAFVHAETRAELLAALGLARGFGIEPVLVGADEAGECLDQIAAARAAVALRTLRPEMTDEQLRLPAMLEQRGVPFCFVGEPAELRATAALAVRHGCSRQAALAALTRTPAGLCSAAEVVGSLRRGCDADFAVFSGDPLDLTSRLRAVYVSGARLFGAAPDPVREKVGAPVGEEGL